MCIISNQRKGKNMKYKDIIKMPMPSPNSHNDISIEDMTKLAIIQKIPETL